MKVDLHFHFRRRRDDRMERLASMAKRAEEHGIRGIALLDHDFFPTDDIMEAARKAVPSITFWRACELTIRDKARGVSDHVVVVSDAGLPFDVSHGMDEDSLWRLVEAAQSEEVLTMLAHPFRRHTGVAFDFLQFCPTLIDAVGRTANQGQLRQVVSLAAQHRMGLASSSDSHSKRHVGRHCMDFREEARTVRDLTRMVKMSYYSLITA